MKKIIVWLILLSVVVLAWCKTEQEQYDKTKKWCTMDWYVVVQSYSKRISWTHYYNCVAIRPKNRADRFNDCSYDCDRAIDDYRDVSNIEDLTIWCLNLCMWE